MSLMISLHGQRIQGLFRYRSFIYGATGALSLSLAAICLLFVHPLTIYSVFLLVSAAFSTFFVLDTTLIKQWLFMVAASVFMAALSFLVLLYNTHEIATLLTIFFAALVVYLISEKYPATLAAVKMGMAIFCFAAVQTNLSMMPSAPHALSMSSVLTFLYCILVGCLCTIVAATVIYVCFNAIPAWYVRRRFNRLIFSLFELPEDGLTSNLVATAEQYVQLAKTLNAFRSPRQAHARQTLMMALIDLQRWLVTLNDSDASIRSSVRELLQQCVTVVRTGHDIDLMELYDAFLLNESPLLKQWLRDNETLSDSLARAGHSLRQICLYSHLCFSNAPSFACMGHHLSQKTTSTGSVHSLTKQNTVSNYSKSAARSAFALAVAYIVTLFVPFQIPAWLLASTNTVMLFNDGATVQKGLQRIAGHVVGFGLAMFVGYFVWPYFSTPFFWVPVLMFLCGYYCLSNYFLYCVFLIVIIVFLFQGLHLISPGDYSLLQVAGFRTIDVVAGCMIPVVIVGLLSFRAYERLLADHSLTLHRTVTNITAQLKQQLPLDLPDVMACQHLLALQCSDRYDCLASSRYQLRQQHVMHRSVLQQQLANNQALKQCLSDLLILSAEYAPTDETLSKLYGVCDVSSWLSWVEHRLQLPLRASTMRRAANDVDEFSQSLMSLDCDQWLLCDQVAVHEWIYIKQWRLIFMDFFSVFR